jgi:hypothetical protein
MARRAAPTASKSRAASSKDDLAAWRWRRRRLQSAGDQQRSGQVVAGRRQPGVAAQRALVRFGRSLDVASSGREQTPAAGSDRSSPQAGGPSSTGFEILDDAFGLLDTANPDQGFGGVGPERNDGRIGQAKRHHLGGGRGQKRRSCSRVADRQLHHAQRPLGMQSSDGEPRLCQRRHRLRRRRPGLIDTARPGRHQAFNR